LEELGLWPGRSPPDLKHVVIQLAPDTSTPVNPGTKADGLLQVLPASVMGGVSGKGTAEQRNTEMSAGVRGCTGDANGGGGGVEGCRVVWRARHGLPTPTMHRDRMLGPWLSQLLAASPQLAPQVMYHQ
jgi:hypothetical protein